MGGTYGIMCTFSNQFNVKYAVTNEYKYKVKVQKNKQFL